MSSTSGPRTRRTVPVIASTEWIEYQPENAVAVAQWLGDRGVHCELAFGRGDGVTLWRGSAMGRETVKPGQWVGVQRPGSCWVVDAGQLDDATRYREVAPVFTGPLTTHTEVRVGGAS